MTKVFSPIIIIAVMVMSSIGVNTTAVHASDQEYEAAIPPLPEVDVKVNGLDGPMWAEENMILDVSWTSKNAKDCITSGSYMPLVNPFMAQGHALITTDIRELPVSGSFEIYARHVRPNVRRVYVVIQCYGPYYSVGEGSSRSDYGKDTVTIDLIDPISVAQAKITTLQGERDRLAAQLISSLTLRISELRAQLARMQAKG